MPGTPSAKPQPRLTIGQVAQIAALTACQEVITFKVKLYEESLALSTIDPIWAPPNHA